MVGTPDTVKFVDSKLGRIVNLNTFVGQPHVFGFFDSKCRITLKNKKRVKLFSDFFNRYDQELVVLQSTIANRITHFDCILKLMKEISSNALSSKEPVMINIPRVQVSLDEDAPQDPNPESVISLDITNPEEYKKAKLYNLPQRDVFMLSGRFWDNVRYAKGRYGIISFWQFEQEVVKHKDLVIKFFDEIGIFSDEFDTIYIQFLGQNDTNQPRKTVAEFLSEKSKVKKVSKEDKEKAIKAKAILHQLSGIKGVSALKNKSFGTTTQAKQAEQSGAGSVAEWKSKRTEGD
jgi:hypothetical protein